MDRRSRSTSTSRHHDPYHAVSEVYTKEVTHRPIGPVSEFPPEILNILREEPRAPHSPPLVRSRENTWTPENFPIVRVPSAQFTDIMTELFDYHEVEKYTRRSVTPEPLHRQPEIVTKAPPPTYHVIPPTPEKNTPRAPPGGIPLSSATEPTKKPLPMYEEYVKMQEENLQNRNSIPIPRPRSRSRSPLTSSGSDSRNNNVNEKLRHIDSSSSSDSFGESGTITRKQEETLMPRPPSYAGYPEKVREQPKFTAPDPPATFTKPEDIGKRYVYSHDVYVDSTTGRPFTPGREDLREKKNCDKLKINVYFKPPHPPVEETYKLDEIEIEKHDDILVSKLRPFSDTILPRSASSNPSLSTSPLLQNTTENPSDMDHRRIPTRTSVLRKEHEILTVPLNRSQSLRQSRISEHSTRRSASKTITERSIPIHVAKEETDSIHMSDIFPKMPHHQMQTNVQGYPQSRSSTRTHVTGSIDKGEHHRQRVIPTHQRRPEHEQAPTPELPLTRGLSKTPSDKDYRVKEEYKVKRPTERSPSFVSSHATSHKTERSPSEVRIPVTVTGRPPQKRQSPEELDYGKFQNGRPDDEHVSNLPYTRGISKTPSDKDFHRNYNTIQPPKEVHIPYNNPEKERAYQLQHQPPKSVPSARSSYRSEQTHKSIVPSHKSETPELPFTRGISKTPSEKSFQKYSNPIVTQDPKEIHIPYNNPEKERAYQQAYSPKPVQDLKEVHIPYNNPEKERAYQQANSPKRVPSGRTHSPPKRTKSPGSKPRLAPPSQGPFEEIVHIKERYERDETIRRFFPTTTTV